MFLGYTILFNCIYLSFYKPFLLKASKYIEQASKNGGLYATASATFNVKGTSKERIDIEVRKGLAFVPDN